MISEESKFLLRTRTTHRHTPAHSVFSSLSLSLSCPAGSHQTLSVKHSFLLPPVEFTVSLLFAQTCNALLCFDIGGASLLLRLCCFNLSAACLSNSTFLYKTKASWGEIPWLPQFHRVQSRPPGWLLCHVWPASPLWALTAFCLHPLCFSPSLHFLSFIPLQRLTETQEHVSQPPLHPLWLQIPFDHAVDTWNQLKLHLLEWTIMDGTAVFLGLFECANH